MVKEVQSLNTSIFVNDTFEPEYVKVQVIYINVSRQKFLSPTSTTALYSY